MKSVSSEFREQLNSGNRNYIKTADIILKNGDVLHVDNGNMWNNGLTIEDSTSNISSFDIGAVIVGSATLVLNNIYDDYTDCDFTDCIMNNIKVGLQLPDGTIEYVQYGKYYLHDAKYNGSIITLSFYDGISKFDKDYSLSNLSYPATLRQIVQDACNVCEVTLGTQSFGHDDYVVDSKPDDTSLTFRQVIAWVAQISCNYGKCDEQGRFCLEWYDLEILENIKEETNLEDVLGSVITDYKNQVIITIIEKQNFNTSTLSDEGNQYHTIASNTRLSVGTDDVVITGIRVSQEIEGEDGTETVIYQSGTDGYVLNIDGNKLIQGNNGSTVASMISTKTVGVKFRTFDASSLSDPTIESGDVAILVDRKGKIYKTLITNNRFNPGNFQNISCGAVPPARNSASRYSQITQVYVDYRKDIKKERTERENALQELSDRIDNSSGLFTTEEVQPNGSTIFYLHNKPELSESDIVWRMTAEAWGVSTDGGKTYNAGMTVDGDTIVRILTAVGVNADWIKTGALRIEKNGQVMLNADIDTGQVDIVANSFSLQGRSIDEIAEQQLNDFVDAVYDPTISNLQSQIDGQIETWFYDYLPTTENSPANQWTTDSEKDKHLGDLFYVVDNEEYGGQAYRWAKIGTEHKWDYVEDTATVKALADAAKAQDTADQKRRVFISTPIPPYDDGDLWMQGSDGDIMTCVNSRQSGNYVSTDWEKKNKYTDDSAVVNLDESLNQESIFNRLTNNGQSEGLYLKDGHLYFNGTYIQSGVIQVLSDDGSIIFKADMDNGSVSISGDNVFIGDVPLVSNLENLQSQINEIEVSEQEEVIYYGDSLIKDPYFTKLSGEQSCWEKSENLEAFLPDENVEITDPLGDKKYVEIYKNSNASESDFFGNNPDTNPIISDDNYGDVFEISFYAKSVSGSFLRCYLCINGYYSRYKYITVSGEWHKFSFRQKLNKTESNQMTFGISPVETGESNAVLLYKPECYIVRGAEDGNNLINDSKFTTIYSPNLSCWKTPGSVNFRIYSYFGNWKSTIDTNIINSDSAFDDPVGGKNAIVAVNANISDGYISADYDNNPVIVEPGTYRVSVWLKKVSNSDLTIQLSFNRGQLGNINLTNEWKQYSYVKKVNAVNDSSGYELFTIGGFGSWTHGTICVYDPRVEKVYTDEDIFNLLTDFGEKKGLYMIDGELYFSASYIQSGIFKIADSNGNETLYANVDTGEVRINATSFSLTSGKTLDSVVNEANAYTDEAKSEAIKYTDDRLVEYDPANELTQEDVFNILTDNGEAQGIYLDGGRLYINASFIKSGTLVLGGNSNSNGILEIRDSSNRVIGRLNNSGAELTGVFRNESGQEYIEIDESVLKGGYGNTHHGTLDLSAQYADGTYKVALESITSEIVLKSKNGGVEIVRTDGDSDITYGFAIGSYDSGSSTRIVSIYTTQSGGDYYIAFENTQGTTRFAILTTSDQRLKRNICDSSINAIEKILKIKHKSYDLLNDVGHKNCGYVAQQLQEINPEWVVSVQQKDEHGYLKDDILQVNDFALLPYITKSIQELYMENQKLKNDIIEMKKILKGEK